MAIRDEKRFEDLAGPMTADEFFTGDYPEFKLKRAVAEFREILNNSASLSVVRSEFKRLFPEGGK